MMDKKEITPNRRNNGEEALQRLEQTAYDVAILDVMLPGMSGFQVCDWLRERSDVPIIMLTARDAEGDRVRGLDTGADDYVVKPFSTRELVSRVRSILRRRALDTRAAAQSHIYTVGDLHLDLLQHGAEWAGQPLRLTESEYQILIILAEADGMPVSRQDVMRRLWNSEYVGDERVCDVHVHSIRRKIRQAGGNDRIVQTVRGEGYALSS